MRLARTLKTSVVALAESGAGRSRILCGKALIPTLKRVKKNKLYLKLQLYILCFAYTL